MKLKHIYTLPANKIQIKSYFFNKVSISTLKEWLSSSLNPNLSVIYKCHPACILQLFMY